jgi:hypothetical protein
VNCIRRDQDRSPVARSCEHCDEPLDSVRDGEFLDFPICLRDLKTELISYNFILKNFINIGYK